MFHTDVTKAMWYILVQLGALNNTVSNIGLRAED
jgi:hypothetical protein